MLISANLWNCHVHPRWISCHWARCLILNISFENGVLWYIFLLCTCAISTWILTCTANGKTIYFDLWTKKIRLRHPDIITQHWCIVLHCTKRQKYFANFNFTTFSWQQVWKTCHNNQTAWFTKVLTPHHDGNDSLSLPWGISEQTRETTCQVQPISKLNTW